MGRARTTTIVMMAAVFSDNWNGRKDFNYTLFPNSPEGRTRRITRKSMNPNNSL